MEDAWRIHTNLDITTAVEQYIVTLDVSVDDVQVVEILKSLASLVIVSMDYPKCMLQMLPQNKWSQSGLR
jgi:hypothetical protein